MLARRVVWGLAMVALAAAPAAAQGRGKGLGRGRGPAPAASSAAGSGPTVAIRQFGAWLDDASLLEPAQGWTAVTFGHYRSPGLHQTDFPIVDAAYGLTRRVQVGVSVPFYRLHFPDGSRASGLGDVYFNAKVSVIDPAKAKNGIGLAVVPIVEVLSQPDPIEGGRFFWAAPVSVELRQPKFRLYGSGGYFSRGAVFGSGAVEAPVTDRLIVTGALIITRALNADPAADALALSKSRSDLTGGVVYVLGPSIAAFGSIGRTISTSDPNSLSLMLSGGVSFTFAGRTVRGGTK